MNPLSIQLTNVRTFREVSLDLPEGLLAVIGENGAGKSTLIGAIDVALFGPEGRSLASWYPRGIGTDPLEIVLVFEHADEIYRVRRTFSPKGRGMSKLDVEHLLGEWGPMGSTEGTQIWEPLTLESQTATQEQIESIIGLSRATFHASSYLAQGDTGAFCDAPARDRKAILGEVVGLADWERHLKRARREKAEVETRIALASDAIARADDELGQKAMVQAERDRLAVEAEKTTELESARERLADARARHTEAVAQVERRASAARAQHTAEIVLMDLSAQIEKRESELADIDARLAHRPELERVAATLAERERERDTLRADIGRWQERERLVREIATVEERRRGHVNEAERLEALADRYERGIGKEHCDRCNQILGEEAARHAAAGARDERMHELAEADVAAEFLSALHATLDGMPTEEPNTRLLPILSEAIEKAQRATSALAALGEVEARRATVTADLAEFRNLLPERERALALANVELASFGTYDEHLVPRIAAEVHDYEGVERYLMRVIGEAQQTIARYDERLARFETLEQETEQRHAEMLRAQARLALLAGMERACSANGIPALILETIAIPQVEAEATRILRQLGGPATAAELRTLRENKSGGVSDALDIVLTTETGDAPYETFSTGEKARIALALRLALAGLLAGRKGAATGLLVIDEIDGLDTHGVSALVGVLEELQRSVPRIIVVSHDANLRDAFPNTLLLANEDGRSRIVGTAIEEEVVL